MLVLICVILIILALDGGAWGSGRYGPAAFSPVGLLVLLFLILILTGSLRL